MPKKIPQNFMANPIQLTTLPNNTMLKNPQFNFPLKPLKPYLNSIKPQSFKLNYKLNNLKQSLNSLTNYLTNKNVINLTLNDAYSSILEICANNKSLKLGQQVHTQMITNNVYENLVFLRTKLVFMYAKCGSVSNARKVFDEMPQRSIFTWNAILGAYVSNGMPKGTIELYREMRVLGVAVDACTFPSVLKACGLVKDLRLGREVHCYVYKTGFDSNGFIVNALVSMYAKCEDVDGARRVFDRIEDREDVVLWNSIVSAYSVIGRGVEVFSLLREMRNVGVGMNSYTYVCALQSCDESLKRLGMELHGVVLKSSDILHLFVSNALLVMYTRCGRMREAGQIFRGMVEKDSVSWNSMLSGYLQNGCYKESLEFFREMLDGGLKADQVSIISVLGASGRLKNMLNGMEAHAYAIKYGFDADIQVANSLIDMYAKCCQVSYMDRIFKSMGDKDMISWTTVIAGYAQNRHYENALDMFREVMTKRVEIDAMMIGSVLLACASLKQINHVKETHAYVLRNGLSDLVLSNTLMDAYGECDDIELTSRLFKLIKNKDVVSWTTMISAYENTGLGNEALDIFRLMKEAGVRPDSVTLVSLLSAIASLSALRNGKEVHGFLVKQGIQLQGSIASSLVDMYARCGNPENSLKVFNIVEEKDAVLWTCMIHSSGMHGRGQEAIDLFNKMEMENTRPDHITFLALLYACSHSGMIDEGERYLELMQSKYNLDPWPEHYACVVDLLGRSNRLDEAYDFVKKMSTEPNAVVWCSLLGACHVHSNKKIADIATKKLLDLEPENPGNYVLVSNAFAASGRWDEVELVRERMREKGLKKSPACSWIELGDKVHTFMARDKSHPKSEQIYEKLAEIIDTLRKEGGYNPQTKFVLHNVEEEEKVKMLYGHSERLAIAYALLQSPKGVPIRVTKNLRVCGDCHNFIKLVSRFFERKIIVRDVSRFHHFCQGSCSCGDFW